MQKIKAVNIKCGGCKKSISAALAKQGIKNIKVDVDEQLISFDGDPILAKKILTKMGYPEAGSKEAKSLLKKSKSYLSCMIGKVKN